MLGKNFWQMANCNGDDGCNNILYPKCLHSLQWGWYQLECAFGPQWNNVVQEKFRFALVYSWVFSNSRHYSWVRSNIILFKKACKRGERVTAEQNWLFPSFVLRQIADNCNNSYCSRRLMHLIDYKVLINIMVVRTSWTDLIMLSQLHEDKIIAWSSSVKNWTKNSSHRVLVGVVVSYPSVVVVFVRVVVG